MGWAFALDFYKGSIMVAFIPLSRILYRLSQLIVELRIWCSIIIYFNVVSLVVSLVFVNSGSSLCCNINKWSYYLESCVKWEVLNELIFIGKWLLWWIVMSFCDTVLKANKLYSSWNGIITQQITDNIQDYNIWEHSFW